MRSARLVALFVGFYLLASIGSAYAECAWVLWQTTSAGSSILSGYESAIVCRRAITARRNDIVRLYQTGHDLETGDTPAVMVQGQDGKMEIFAWKCLPDTIDPREQKGSGR